MDRKEEALRALKMANEKGMILGGGQRYKKDIFLKPLFGDTSFEELVRPKG